MSTLDFIQTLSALQAMIGRDVGVSVRSGRDRMRCIAMFSGSLGGEAGAMLPLAGDTPESAKFVVHDAGAVRASVFVVDPPPAFGGAELADGVLQVTTGDVLVCVLPTDGVLG